MLNLFVFDNYFTYGEGHPKRQDIQEIHSL